MSLAGEVVFWVCAVVFVWAMHSCLEFPAIRYLKLRDKLQKKLEKLQVKQQKLEQEKKSTQEELKHLNDSFNEYLLKESEYQARKKQI